MSVQQPKPDYKKHSDLISEIQKGIIKIPKFQRDFVWSIDKTAQLLDSILKGYPIGTFILWQTDERINDIKNIGNLKIPPTPEGTKVQYVLDGQQRITSLYAAYLGAQLQKNGEKKVTDYTQIFVNLDKDINENDDQVITSEPTGDNYRKMKEIQEQYFELQLIEVIKKYIGNEFSSHVKITFPEHEDSKICLVKISKSGKPVFILFEGTEDFFIRSGCSSQPLSREEQSQYEKSHWK